MKLVILFCFLIVGFVSFAQEEEDSVEVINEARVDTLRTNHLGISLGVHFAYPFISPKIGAPGLDSIFNWGGKSQYGIVVGLQWLNKLNDKFYIQSGASIFISKLNYQMYQNGTKIDASIPYSILEIPFNLFYIPNFKKNSFNASAGFTYNLDITKKADKDSRIISLRTNNLIVNTAIGYTFVNSEGTHYQTQLIGSYGLINLLKPNRVDISTNLQSLYRSQIAFVITVY